MALEARLRSRDDLEPVSEEEVIRYWLGEELDEAETNESGADESEVGDSEADDPDTDTPNPDAFDTEPALREELFEREPIAERVFGAEPADWYDVELSATELRDLRVVVGPHDEDWRALTDDNRIESIAELVYEADDVAELDAETPKDLREVVEFADELERGGSVGRLVVVKEGDDPAYIADGNHRAVAHVLSLLRGGEFEGESGEFGGGGGDFEGEGGDFESQEVYMGVRA